jgi:citrate lyase subunit beta / citryl-CoA lyase
MKPRIQRSMLILPVNVSKFVEKAYLRGADAIALDLEDSVPPGEKENARKLIPDALTTVGKGGADVLVRVNNEPDLLQLDIEAAVISGVHGVFVPKVETVEDVATVDATITKLEKERGLPPGRTRLSLHVESPKGLLNIYQIATASSRTESMSLGVDDYCLHLGVEPSEDARELFLPLSMLVIACKAAGIHPLGIHGSVAGFGDPVAFERAAQRGREMGCTGAFCIHPDQVAILNRVFSPSPAKVIHARRVVAAFEEGLKKGRAAVTLENRMVDTPVYKQALALLERAEAIEDREQQKAEALAKTQTQA